MWSLQVVLHSDLLNPFNVTTLKQPESSMSQTNFLRWFKNYKSNFSWTWSLFKLGPLTIPLTV